MHCKFCGQEIPDKAVVCDWCGLRQAEDSGEEAPQRRLTPRGRMGPQGKPFEAEAAEEPAAANEPAGVPAPDSLTANEPAGATAPDSIAAREEVRAPQAQILIVIAAIIVLLGVADLVLVFISPDSAHQLLVRYYSSYGRYHLSPRVGIDIAGLFGLLAILNWRDASARRGAMICQGMILFCSLLNVLTGTTVAAPLALDLTRDSLALYLLLALWQLNSQLEPRWLD